MKRMAVLLLLLLCWTGPCEAFLYNLRMLSEVEVSALSDEDLKSTFLEAKIEEKASAEFHRGAGFSNAKEYEKRKQLLRFIIYLHREMDKRGITPDPIDSWLK
ncbi:MAG: hypothetical protein KC900_06010 [Candidatus Omnitrophica bacterium]|nr:hypothetical protein [Candidatus Omnitrophota bacterium]